MKKIRSIWLPVLVFMGIQVVIFCACDKEDDKVTPGLTTGTVKKVTDNSACCCGMVNIEGSSAVSERGICWCTSDNPTLASNVLKDSKGAETFECEITGLSPNTTYYARAFATNDAGTAYGDVVSFKTPPTVKDLDGNVYHTVVIGNHIWMAENLKVTKYRNGDPIPEVTVLTIWANLTMGAYTELPASFNKGYGKLYNFYAVADIRSIAPDGWHVATDAEWKNLEGWVDDKYPVGDPAWDNVGYRGTNAGGNLKSTTDQWVEPNDGATDKFGFSALPGGYMEYNTDGFKFFGEQACFWTSTQASASEAWTRVLFNSVTTIDRFSYYHNAGGSIRCVRD
jgi:uncharacterized protein (TIGR02145 family)